MDWITCNSCEEEFRVISDTTDMTSQYCPFCGEDLKDEEDQVYDWAFGDNVTFR